MKLHRLVLSNYRGIAHREIEFPDHGVVVVSGANEIGKSSMVQALDLLLKFKDRSANKEVKAAQPTHADVGSEVTAEISTGPYRFVYHKRFHKRPETVLTVFEPRREQLTGDEAHERVRAILDETVDTALWEAQRVLQAASTDAVDLSGCDALSRALDIAAGDDAMLSGTEPRLLEKIDAEYARYFTPTGRRETGELAIATAALTMAQAEADRHAGLVAEVDERVRRHDELTGKLATLTAQRDGVDARCAAARAAADRVGRLNEALRDAELVADAAKATGAASAAEHAERQRLRTDLEMRTTAVADLEKQVREAAAAEVAARAAATAATAAEATATGVAVDVEQAVKTARRLVAQLANRDEADRLADRLTRIDIAQRDRDRISDELAAIVLTDDLMRRIESAAVAADRAEATLAAIAATVEFTAAADIELVVDDQRVSLPAGRSWSTTATTPTEVGVAGVLIARITPGATGLDAQAKHAAAQQGLREALTAGGVADVTEARRLDQRRRELSGSRDQLSAGLAALRGDDQVDGLRARLARLRADQPDEMPDMTLEAARAELDAVEAARCHAAADSEARRAAAAAAAHELSEKATSTTVLRDKVTGQRAELDAVAVRLVEQRTRIGDDDLAGAATAGQQAAAAAAERVAQLTQQLAAMVPDSVTAELDAATAAAEALHTDIDQVAGALRDIGVELAVFGTEGRHSGLDAAQADLEHAAAAHARVDRRARAVRLLRAVMTRHRDDTRLRYVEPFRAEVQRLGRRVFGDGFEVDVDTDLGIRSRTLNGCTVPYDSLSGGAKEQLGILVRLAGAALVAKEDTVPVLIDDALGFTDPDRLASMGAVFDAVGAHGQVIVLTCTPDRYRSVQGAYRIELNA